MLLSDVPKEIINLLKNCNISGVRYAIEDIVVLKEDKRGKYVKYVFKDDIVPNNRHLDDWSKQLQVGHMYRLHEHKYLEPKILKKFGRWHLFTELNPTMKTICIGLDDVIKLLK